MEVILYYCLWSNPNTFACDFSGHRIQARHLPVPLEMKVEALKKYALTGDDEAHRLNLFVIRSTQRRFKKMAEEDLHTVKSFEEIVRRDMREPVRSPDGFDSHLRSLQEARRSYVRRMGFVKAKVREEKALEAAFHVVKLFRDIQQATKKR